jgi:predicted DNA-binding protein with PD1-like motif
MKVLQGDAGDVRAFAIVFGSDEPVMAGLRELARTHGIRGAHFTAIGAFRTATIAYFHWESRTYEEIVVAENVEVAPLVGNVGTNDAGEVIVHAHCTLGRRDGSALAGHLIEATVRPTLELFLTTGVPPLVRRLDPASGLFLLGR